LCPFLLKLRRAGRVASARGARGGELVQLTSGQGE